MVIKIKGSTYSNKRIVKIPIIFFRNDYHLGINFVKILCLKEFC